MDVRIQGTNPIAGGECVDFFVNIQFALPGEEVNMPGGCQGSQGEEADRPRQVVQPKDSRTWDFLVESNGASWEGWDESLEAVRQGSERSFE